jgi:hypothetical protein
MIRLARCAFGAWALTVLLFASAPTAVLAGGPTTGSGKTGSAVNARGKGATVGVRQPRHVTVVRGAIVSRRFGWSDVEGPSFLIVDALPLHAQVFLDGRPLGSAADLIARALPLAPGRHTVQVTAPGSEPHAAQFVADPSFPTRLRIVLSHR